MWAHLSDPERNRGKQSPVPEGLKGHHSDHGHRRLHLAVLALLLTTAVVALILGVVASSGARHHPRTSSPIMRLLVFAALSAISVSPCPGGCCGWSYLPQGVHDDDRSVLLRHDVSGAPRPPRSTGR